MKPIYQTEQPVQGVSTKILVQSFSDRVMVLVTQMGKVGCLIQASLPQTVPIPPPSRAPGTDNAPSTRVIPPAPPPAIELTPLLGHPPTPELHTFYNLLSAQLATVVWSSEEADGNSFGGTRRPVVVGIALKRDDSDSRDAELGEHSGSRLEVKYTAIVDTLVQLLAEE